MRRKVKEHVSHDRWLISYADFITLLFAFFVVLYAFAKADQKRQSEVSEAIDTAFQSLGLFGSSTNSSSNARSSSASEHSVMAMNIVMGEDVLSPAQVKNDLDRMQRDLEHKLSNQVA